MQATITGTGHTLPAHVLSNSDLCGMVETSDEWIVSRTGIRERRISDGEPLFRMAARAAGEALAMAGKTPMDVDMIVATTATPDCYFPSLSCLVQGALGAEHAFAFDLGAACSGFVFALDVADQYIRLGRARCVLVVSAEQLSRVTNYKNRATCILFGDGAGAAVLEPAESGGVMATHLGSQGNGGQQLYCSCTYPDTPFTPEGFRPAFEPSGAPYMSMNGAEVFKFAVRAMPDEIDRVLQSAGKTIDDVKLIIPHQANARIIKAVIDRYHLPSEKVVVTLDRFGNTSSASVPIALDLLVRDGKLTRGDLLLMVAFGAGLTSGAVLMQWTME